MLGRYCDKKLTYCVPELNPEVEEGPLGLWDEWRELGRLFIAPPYSEVELTDLNIRKGMNSLKIYNV